MDYNIKKLEYEDIESYVNLNIKCFKETYHDILSNEYLNNFELKKDEFVKEEQAYFNSDNDLIFLLVQNNKFIGYLAVGKSKINKYLDYGEIKSLYLLKKYQGYGYGKLLFNYGINQLKKIGFKNICIGCLKENVRANNFYIHLGCKLIDCHETITGNKKMLENIYLIGGLI